jgi:hypothetical protein
VSLQISRDVDRGLAIRKEIEALSEELKGIEERLKNHGLAHPDQQIELNDPEREGRQFLARGETSVVPVVFTADILAKSFEDESSRHKLMETIVRVADVPLKKFYVRSPKWEITEDNGKKFRQLADELLGKHAPAFITACLARDKYGMPKSAIKVEWTRASEEAA